MSTHFEAPGVLRQPFGDGPDLVHHAAVFAGNAVPLPVLHRTFGAICAANDKNEDWANAASNDLSIHDPLDGRTK